jgi:hypothetical protein
MEGGVEPWRDARAVRRLAPGCVVGGLALRANLFGYAVGQLDFSRPFQRRGSGWVVQFNLSPGF